MISHEEEIRAVRTALFMAGGIPEEIVVSDNPEQVLRNMEAACSKFYAMAVLTGCHAFIEFAGVMREWIEACRHAHAQGLDFMHLNVHGDEHVPLQERHRVYIREKLDCIFGSQLDMTRIVT